MSEKQSQIVSVEACCVVEIRRFLSFEMSPDQVLAFVAHVEDWLARISHTRPAAASDSGASAALPLLGLLDVLHEYDCGGLRRAPCIRIALQRLATDPCEKYGPGCRHFLDRLSGLLIQRGYVNRRLAQRSGDE